ncbi:hypothetical protein E2C01_096857 [Portunus trituberculatus]|uniref:Uncharacterized protein n=1 Tax=Portunus trituberculatus TaxID=210409 RepID=A0A5B7K348_PORTR|nr:hypothetical protein [Portunus trituberculatus]
MSEVVVVMMVMMGMMGMVVEMVVAAVLEWRMDWNCCCDGNGGVKGGCVDGGGAGCGRKEWERVVVGSVGVGGGNDAVSNGGGGGVMKEDIPQCIFSDDN